MPDYASLHESIMPVLRLLLQPVPLRVGAIVLDLASGSGEKHPLFQTAYPGARIVALDYDRYVVRKARESGCDAVVGDAHDLPFQDRCCDVVVCIAALGLFEQPVVALADVRRVLRPDGRALFVTAERRWASVTPWPAELADYVPELPPAHTDHAEACERVPIAAGLKVARSYAIPVAVEQNPIVAALMLNDWTQIKPRVAGLPLNLRNACEAATTKTEIELCDVCLAAWCSA